MSQSQWISAGVDIQILVKLNTPIEIDIDPVEVRSLYGFNTYYCNSGKTYVFYSMDLAKYISDKTTEVQEEEQAKLEKAFATDTASGAVATFTDGADDIPMKSVKVAIEPVQDLHGYDHPWPAGGGKNKFHNTGVTTTSNGVTFTVNADGTVSCSGTASGTAVFHVFLSYSDLPQGESLILNGCPAGGNFTSNYGTALCDVNGAALDPATDSGAGVTYTPANLADLAQYQIVVRSGINANGLVFKPMIRLASETDATFAPYSNICPISGWTGAQVVRTGKNLFDSATVFASFGFTHEDDGSWSRENIYGIANTQLWENPGFVSQISIRFTAKYASDTSTGIRFKFKYTDGTFGNLYLTPSLTYQNYTFTSNSGKVVSAIFFDYGSNNTKTWFKDVQFEASSTATEYEPYTGNTYPITFPSEAGTVYGGELDVTNGTLTVDRAMVDLGTLNFSNYDEYNERWNTTISDKKSTGGRSANLWSDRWNATTKAATGDEGVMFGYLQNVYFYTSDSNNTPTGQLVYELATPIVYHLTPTEIKSLLGDNNIWADAGDTEVTYRADTKLYIEKKIAEVVNALS